MKLWVPFKRFQVLLFVFSKFCPMWYANLFVKLSESRNRWSGFFNGWEALGLGRTVCWAVLLVGDDALEEWDERLAGDAWRIFFGRLESGLECNTSFYIMYVG